MATLLDRPGFIKKHYIEAFFSMIIADRGNIYIGHPIIGPDQYYVDEPVQI